MRLTTFVAAILPSIAASVRAADICNGDSSLCFRSYSNVTYIGAHDSYANGTSIADNQDKGVVAQLNDGVRALQIQTHNAADGIHLCHTSCSLLDGGTLESYLTKLAGWLQVNPGDVVTLVMVNIDDLAPTAFTSAFNASGAVDRTYSPPNATLSLDEWPTLSELTNANTNLVVFMDTQADFSSVPYLIDEFSHMFEDAYDVTNPTWDCSANRSTGNPGSSMMLINHFLDLTYTIAGTQLFVPDKTSINTTNSENSIDQHVNNCQNIWGRNPNVILLDFYDSNGNSPFDVAAALNGLAAPSTTVTSGSVTAGSATLNTSTSSPSMTASVTKLSGAERVAFGMPGVWPSFAGVVLGIVGGNGGALLVELLAMDPEGVSLAKARGKDMASLLKASAKIQSRSKSDSKGQAASANDENETDKVKATGKPRKDKVLLICSRGVTQRMRHLMRDIEVLLPHTKKDSKLDSKSSLHLLNELSDLHSCTNTLYLEARRHEDLYLWLSRSPNGPSVKCQVQNVHTMDELKMTGNCLRGSRGICVFDGAWDGDEHWTLMKEMFTHVFSVPRTSRRLKPFVDHVLVFSILDNKVWFRNYQIIEKDPLQPSGPPQTSLVEIGPRFVLTPIRIFEGSFGGPTVFENAEFVSPAAVRSSMRREAGDKYRSRKEGEGERKERGKRRREDVADDQLGRKKVFA
ncbi:MAG: Ribosome bioproteinsis protein brx1 [Tremellales sp. Tagirdzhanova-0007]|nr:MAG: Ribosome bioproteinsis protein brx1 [Tremellales sp. Tagirdzhanova-0007]